MLDTNSVSYILHCFSIQCVNFHNFFNKYLLLLFFFQCFQIYMVLATPFVWSLLVYVLLLSPFLRKKEFLNEYSVLMFFLNLSGHKLVSLLDKNVWVLYFSCSVCIKTLVFFCSQEKLESWMILLLFYLCLLNENLIHIQYQHYLRLMVFI